MARYLAFTLAALVLLVFLGLAALYAFRVPVAQVLLERVAAGLGVPNPRFEVTTLDTSGAALRHISAGDADEFKANALDLRYRLTDIFERPLTDLIEEVWLEGLQLQLDLTGGPPLGSLQPLLDRSASTETDSAPFPLPDLPRVAIENAVVDIAHPGGRSVLHFDAWSRPRDDGRIYAHATPRLDGAIGNATGTAHALVGASGSVDGSLVIDDGALLVPAGLAGIDAAVSGLSGAVAFAVENGAPSSVTADLQFDEIFIFANSIKNGSLSLDINENEISGEGNLESDDGKVAAYFDAAMSDPGGVPEVDVSLAVEAAADAALLSSLDLPFQPADGGAELRVRLWGKAGALDEWVSAAQGSVRSEPFARLPETTALGARFAVSLGDLEDGEIYTGLDAEVSGTASVADGELRLALAEGSRLTAAGIDEAWLIEAGVPAELSSLFATNLLLDLPSLAETPPRARIRHDGTDYQIDLSGALRVSSSADPRPNATAQTVARLALNPDWQLQDFIADFPRIEARGFSIAGFPIQSVTLAADVSGTPEAFKGTAETALDMAGIRVGDLRSGALSLRLPLAFRFSGPTFETIITAPGRLDAASLRFGDYSVADGAGLSIPSGWLRLEREANAKTAAGLSHELVLKPDPFVVVIPRDNGPPLRAEIALQALRVTGRVPNDQPYKGRAALTGGSLLVPDLVAIDSLSATTDFDLDMSRPAVAFEAQSIEALGDQALTPPLHLAGTIRRRGNTIAFDGEATPRVFVAGAPSFALSGSYDVSKATGAIDLTPTSIVFAPGELQPVDLVAVLSPLRNAAGRAEVGATLGLDTDGIQGTSALNLSGLSFEMDELSVDDLNLSLALASLVPPSSPPGQAISIGHIESVMPIDDLRASYQVLPGDIPKAKVERLSFTLGGGTFTLRDVLLDPASERHRLNIEIQGLQLGEALAAADIGGLTGDGRISGVIPVAIDGETYSIEDGRLTADGPGALRFRSADLTSSLPPDADALDLLQSPVDLALRAFEDFQYDTLAIAVDKTADGEAVMKLTLAGKNPALLEGYPFVFNINLAGNLNPIMDALQQGLRLSDAVFGQAWTLR